MTDLRDFLKSISAQIHLVTIPPEGGATRGVDLGKDIDTAEAWARQYNAEGNNIYFTVNTVRPGVNKKPTMADIVAVRFAHVDIDPPKDGGPFDASTVYGRLEKAVVPPSFVNWSGNGMQAFWRLKPGATIEQTEQANRGLIAVFGGDPGTQNIDRLMRVPGTNNYPNAKKRAAGRTVTQAKIKMPDDNSAYAVELLLEAYPAPAHKGRERESIELGDITLLTSADVSSALTFLIDRPTGPDKSADTLKFACEALRVGLTAEQVMGVLLNKDNVVATHCFTQADPKRAARRAVERAMAEPDVRRRVQRAQDQRIGGGEIEQLPTAPIPSLDEMLTSYTSVAVGNMVIDLDRPQLALSWPEFRSHMAAATMLVERAGKNGSTRTIQVQTADIWRGHANRKAVETTTFRAGAPVLTTSPSGRQAVNLWRPPLIAPPPDDWQERIAPFDQHLKWLWCDAAEPFKDWTAHALQRPGELPSYGWLHIAPTQGMGRNLIAGVLARVFAGYTALGVDLGALLTSQFNGVLSGKVLAVVDEVAEGNGVQVYKTAQALKRLITEEVRHINPKYGPQREEYNACRWLIFSNSEMALPLEDNDRRVWVVRSDDQPKDAEYYSMLYQLREDPAFIASVAHSLRTRDISAFKPGALPPMTEAKARLLDRTRSDAETVMREITQTWPSDIISSAKLREFMEDGQLPAPPAMRHMLDRVGWVKVGKTRFSTPYGQQQAKLYVVRNRDDWLSASPDAIRAEMLRGE
jgi:hypothetical protein